MRATLLFETDPAFEDSGARGEGPSSVDLDPRGNLLVATGSWAGILRAETAERVWPLAGFGNGRVAEGKYRFTAGGRRVVGYAAGKSSGLFVWDSADGSEVDRQEDGGPLVAVSADGRIGVEAKPGDSWQAEGAFSAWHSIRGIRNLEEGRRLQGLRATAHGVALSPDGSLALFSGRTESHRWDAHADQRIKGWAEGLTLLSMAWLPGCQKVVAVGQGGSLVILAPNINATPVESSVHPPIDLYGVIAGSSHGSVVAVFGANEPAWLIRVEDGAHLALATPRVITDACFSADGHRLYAVGEGGLLRAWSIDLAERDRYGAKPPP